ncbi:efflux RND transporter periplasmic adaptor subunit [Colwelliaceae bacterium BS250]
MSPIKTILCIISLFLIASCDKPVPVEPDPVEVVATIIEAKTIPLYGEYIAGTKASLDVEVWARVSGYLEETHFIEGSFVTKGQLLFTLDAGPYEATLASSKAKYSQAKNALTKAKRDIKRVEPLFKEDAASQLDLDNAYAALDSAKASLSSAEADLDKSELDLSYTQIRAPISGLSGDSSVDIGALVGEGGTSLLTNVQQVDPLYVEFQMTTLEYLQSRRRLKSYYEKYKADAQGTTVAGLVSIKLPDGSDYPYPAKVKFTEPRVNQQTGTFTARAEVVNPDRELLPGQYTRARLALGQIDNALLVPEQAVLFEQSGSYVYVILPNGTAERRFILVGRNIDGMFIVEKGLADGEQVIFEGTHKVHHGIKVIAVPPKVKSEQVKAVGE